MFCLASTWPNFFQWVWASYKVAYSLVGSVVRRDSQLLEVPLPVPKTGNAADNQHKQGDPDGDPRNSALREPLFGGSYLAALARVSRFLGIIVRCCAGSYRRHLRVALHDCKVHFLPPNFIRRVQARLDIILGVRGESLVAVASPSASFRLNSCVRDNFTKSI